MSGLLDGHLDTTLAHYPARYAPNPIKQWLGYLRHYYPQAAALFARIKRLRDVEDIRACIASAAEGGRRAA